MCKPILVHTRSDPCFYYPHDREKTFISSRVKATCMSLYKFAKTFWSIFCNTSLRVKSELWILFLITVISAPNDSLLISNNL